MKHGKKILVVAAAGLATAALLKKGKSHGEPLAVVGSVDLNRYAGRWYEIARLPNSFQKACASDVMATYTLRADGKVDVLNECRQSNGEMKRASGVARVADENDVNSKLEVRFAPAALSFLPSVWGDYWIIELGANYEYSVVGGPDRDYLWILSRTPRMDGGLYRDLLGRIAAHGFDAGRLMMTEQSARETTFV